MLSFTSFVGHMLLYITLQVPVELNAESSLVECAASNFPLMLGLSPLSILHLPIPGFPSGTELATTLARQSLI